MELLERLTLRAALYQYDNSLSCLQSAIDELEVAEKTKARIFWAEGVEHWGRSVNFWLKRVLTLEVGE